MGDPFSAAGTAVGITSLGIQTCQIIHKYYSDFKGYHDDIDSVLRQAEGLQGILESLHQLKDRLEFEDHASPSQLQLALKACEDALHTLKRVADKCVVTKQAQGLQARVREARKRLLWPFKKETIADLQAKLNAFQNNLSLAVQSAGLDGMLQKFDNLNPSIDAIRDQTADMKQSLATQTRTLSILHQDVAGAALVGHQHHSDLSTELSKLQLQSSQQHAAVEYKLDLVMSRITSYPHASTVPPSLLADSLDMLSDAQCQTSESLMTRQQTTSYTTFAGAQPLCNCRPRKMQTVQYRRWTSIFSEETYQHRPTCPYSAYADQSRTTAAQFTICNRLVSFCVQVGLQRSSRGGWNSIAPVLRYRAVVPQGTGAFGVLEDARNAIWALGRGPSQEQLTGILINTASTLQRTFHTNASPYDMDENGDSLLRVALAVVEEAVSSGVECRSAIRSLLDVCNAPGVSHPNPQNGFFTPMGFWQQSLESNIDPNKRGQWHLYRDVLYYLAQKSGEWTLNNSWRHWILRQHAQEFYDMISTMLKLENMDSFLDEDDPLLLAILRRSRSEFEACISNSDHALLICSLSGRYMEALATWPQALGVMRSIGFFDDSDTLVNSLWQYAVQVRSVESIEVLTRFKKHIASLEWSYLDEAWIMARNMATTREVDEMRWAGSFDAALAKLQPDCLMDSSIEDEGCDQIATSTISPYHSYSLSILGAESAWKAGFRDLNTLQWEDGWPKKYGNFITPLWSFSHQSAVYNIPKENVRVIIWLMDHGANPFWIHPKLLTTPAHNIVRRAKIRAAYKADVSSMSMFEALLLSRTRDRCTCFCSKHGCCCVGLTASKTGDPFYETLQGKQSMRHIVFPYLFGVLDQHKKEHWMSSAVFRMMTFEKLSLTHTCCYRIFSEIWGDVQRPTAEKAQDIHDIQRDDIKLFEKLVTEFAAKWAAYNKPFVTFMNRVWKKRMRQVKEERRVDKESYQAELLRMGVTLEKLNEASTKSDFSDEEETDSDWSDDYESDDGRNGWYTTDEEGEGNDDAEDGSI